MPNLDLLRSAAVEVVEVLPRDGLQNEQNLFSTAQKVALIGRMVAAGAQRIEVVSFARPGRVPQMADAESVIAALNLPANVITIGLVMNMKGTLRALETNVGQLGAVCVATVAFANAN